MTLSPAEFDKLVEAISSSVVRKLRTVEEMKLDAKFFAGNMDEYDRQTEALFREESRKKREGKKLKR